MAKTVAQDKTERVSFASIKNQLPYPDFLEIQLKSFNECIQV